MTEPAKMFPLGFRKGATDQSITETSRRHARDGSALWWGGTDTPGPAQVVTPGYAAPIMVAVSPIRPGHSVAVEYRVNGGSVREAIGLLEPRVLDASARIFRAVVPGQSEGLVEFLPVLRFAGQPISPRLLEEGEPPRYQIGSGGAPAETEELSAAPTACAGRWDWEARFLGPGTIALHKEVVGVVPDGLRIMWRFVETRFVGTYATADKELEWLDRAQRLIVGRADMRALKVESDAYLIEVGERLSTARPEGCGGAIR